jgi:CheY-like chemotaxis protein
MLKTGESKCMNDHACHLKDRNGQWLHSRNCSSGQLILIAEESEADIFFLFRVMEQAGVRNPIFVVRDGLDALAYLEGTGIYADRNKYPGPGIVLLDLAISRVDGLEILRWSQTQKELKKTLFVALSNSPGVYQINSAYEAGTDTFLSKPLDSEDVLNLITSFEDHWDLTHSPRIKVS